MANAPATKPVEFIDILLASAIIIWVTMVILLLAFVSIPDKNQTLFTTIVSVIGSGGLGTLIGYRWGSAKGSEQKTDALVEMASKQ